MSPWKILLADDEPELLKVYSFILEQMGHEVYACQDAEEALQHYQAVDGNFDLLMTDYRMPELNGLQLARILRMFNPGLPIMVVSAICEMGDLLDDEDADVVFMSKPVRYGDIKEQILALQQAA